MRTPIWLLSAEAVRGSVKPRDITSQDQTEGVSDDLRALPNGGVLDTEDDMAAAQLTGDR